MSELPNKRRLSFHTEPYNGKKDNLKREYMNRSEATSTVQDYVNSVQTDTPQTKTVFDISQATGLSEQTVRKVLMENGHGYRGITF